MENYTNVLNCTRDFNGIVSSNITKPVSFENNTIFTTIDPNGNTTTYIRPALKQKVFFNKKSGCKRKNKGFGDNDFGNDDFTDKKSPSPSVTPRVYRATTKNMKKENKLNFFRFLMLSSLIFDGISSNKQLSI